MRFLSLVTFLISFFLASCDSGTSSAGTSVEDVSSIDTMSADESVVTVYSSRAEHLIKPLFDQFTLETGTPVRFITDGEAALIARIEAEGERTAADMLLTVDSGNLWFASSKGILAPVGSEILQAAVPEHLRAEDGSWYALSIRARTLVYSSDRVDPSELDSYESLADEEWKGRLCLRTSKKVYNQSLVASMIAEYGEDRAEEVVEQWVSNLAIDPLPNDNKAMEAVISGVCDVALVNSYYFGRLKEEKPDAPIDIFWANQDGRGVHVNVSGAGITTHANNREGALKLMEWLASGSAQKSFAGLNKEFPVNPAIDAVEEVAAWGEFKSDTVSVERIGQLQLQAVKLMDRAGYN